MKSKLELNTAGSDTEAVSTTTTRGRTRHKSLPEVFFPSPKKPNRLLTRSSINLSSSMSDGDSFAKEVKSGNSSFRSMSGRITPITESLKKTKSTSVPNKSTPSMPAAVDAVLSLQNRFPQSLWPFAEEFFSTSSCMGSGLKSV